MEYEEIMNLTKRELDLQKRERDISEKEKQKLKKEDDLKRNNFNFNFRKVR